MNKLTEIDFSTYGSVQWATLLSEHPQFAKHCDWSKIDGEDWANILSEHPQLSEHCDWTKLSEKNWCFLLSCSSQNLVRRRKKKC